MALVITFSGTLSSITTHKPGANQLGQPPLMDGAYGLLRWIVTASKGVRDQDMDLHRALLKDDAGDGGQVAQGLKKNIR